ncbi:MAG: ECF transporter S component [Oscillospiraceae bacterium]|nr:ECF transporter S component [Oscillospiraceae bacterium]
MTATAKKRQNLYRIVAVGLMAALVYIGNFMQIKFANDARVHLGNSMCLLAGLLFGGLNGGLASGIGGAMYDLFDPIYITSAPYTFLSKFCMGFVAGKLNRINMQNEFVRTVIAALCGQVTYIVLYLGKNFVEQLILGNPMETAMGVMATKAATSCINGGLAVLISIPLYFAIRKALQATGFRILVENSPEKTSE